VGSFSLVLDLDVDWEEEMLLVRNLRITRPVYWVNVSENFGASLPRLSRMKGR